jgi:hypothetical protein
MSTQIVINSGASGRMVSPVVTYDPATKMFTASEPRLPGKVPESASGHSSDAAIIGLAAILAAEPTAAPAAAPASAPAATK